MGLMGKASRHFKDYHCEVPKANKIGKVYKLKNGFICGENTLDTIIRVAAKLGEKIDYEVIKEFKW